MPRVKTKEELEDELMLRFYQSPEYEAFESLITRKIGELHLQMEKPESTETFRYLQGKIAGLREAMAVPRVVTPPEPEVEEEDQGITMYRPRYVEDEPTVR
jgi:hypothetical protein